MLTAGDTQYQYDLDGFLTTKTDGTEVTTYNYSSRGELLNVTLPEGTLIEYVHDPLGRRIAKKINGAITEKYLWQGLTRLLAVYDGSDNLLMRFEYAGLRMPVAMTYGGATYYFAYDQVGSLRAVADSGGNVLKSIEYDSFGNVIEDSNPAFYMPFGFAGGLYDADTGLVRFGYRDYDPDVGRWTAKDPILFAGGDTDLYGYVLNGPVNWIDPVGLISLRSDHAALNQLIWSGKYKDAADLALLMGFSSLAQYMASKHYEPAPIDKPCMDAKSKRGSKPIDAPPGTIPIDESGLSKEDIHTIKEGINAGPKEWTGISPEGDVISGDSEGKSVNNGPYGDYLPHNRRPF